ncbi:13504_t:CDS:2, partial [Dentiscutata erythropus]
WGRAQQYISFNNKVLAIILYSDATTLDRLEKSSRHPIFISLENISTKIRNKAEAKALVGLIPVLQGTKEERQTLQFRQLIRLTFHKCINTLIEPLYLQHRSGVLLKINNYSLKCNMMLACVIGDWPENCKSCLTYSGTSCARCCYTCLVKKDELNAIKLSANRKITRTENQMRQIIAMEQSKEYLLHEEINIKFTRDLLKARGENTLINKMDQRLGIIPHYPGLKIFNTGLADLALFMVLEYRQMMKVMPFVLEGLFAKNENELL